MKEIYTTALLQLLTSKSDTSDVLEGFKRTLQKRGHGVLYGPVLRKVLRVLKAKCPNTQITLASENELTKQKADIETALRQLGATAEPAVVIDDTIIGGYVAEHNHYRLDNSYKSKLLALYRSITK